MLKSIHTKGSAAQIVHIEPGLECLILRRFNPHTDSWSVLTELLHESFSEFTAMGLNSGRATQSTGTTRRIAMAGDCFVAVCHGRIIGTMTLDTADPGSPCPHYRELGVASLRQFCVAPEWQRRGIGSAMIRFAEHWALVRNHTRLALDTPFEALHQVEFYRRLGFNLVGAMRFPEREYQSAVLGKELDANKAPQRQHAVCSAQDQTMQVRALS